MRRLLTAAVLLALAALWPSVASARVTGPSLVRTVPAEPGIPFVVGGRTYLTDSQGTVRLPLSSVVPLPAQVQVKETLLRPGVKAQFSRWYGRVNSRNVTATLGISYLVRLKFHDDAGKPVASDTITAVKLKSGIGQVIPRRGALIDHPFWVLGQRVVALAGGLQTKDIDYSGSLVRIKGANVVNRGQQRFTPSKTTTFDLKLLFYAVRFTSSDLLFGFPVGSAVRLVYPDGSTLRIPLHDGGKASLPALPRGAYKVSVEGPGTSFIRPLSLSKDQLVDLEVLTYYDLIFFGALVISVAVGLVLIGRRQRVRRWLNRVRRPRAKGALALAAALVLLLGLGARLAAAAPKGSGTPARPVPALAYYYIWYNASSWNRAKIDYPLLGRYSSDEAAVMKRHIELAKQAHLTGFIVSWKSSPALDRRLATLVKVAKQEKFKLAIIYQGLDFKRNPLRVPRIERDLDRFAGRYGSDPVFRIFDGKPLVIISGTWRYTPAEVRRIAEPRRKRMLVLASERQVDSYGRLAGLVDGNAYYWSSSGPGQTSGYQRKLDEMGAAVHKGGGLWIAPAAAGFDARLLGGHLVVDRRGGQTLRLALNAAVASSPDAIGVISWNEFSENSHIEPSQRYDGQELRVLAQFLGTELRSTGGALDSSEPEGSRSSRGLFTLIGVGVALVVGAPFLYLRRRRPSGPRRRADT